MIPRVGLIDFSAGQRAGRCPHSWGHGSLGFSSLSRGGSGEEGRVRGKKEGAMQDPGSFLSELGEGCVWISEGPDVELGIMCLGTGMWWLS